MSTPINQSSPWRAVDDDQTFDDTATPDRRKSYAGRDLKALHAAEDIAERRRLARETGEVWEGVK